MAITVKHSKVSTIPDGDDSSVVRPSDWNADHQLVGTVPVDNGGTGASTLTGYVKGNGTSAFTASPTVPNTDITGLGTMSTQNANAVAITGGSITGVTVVGYIPTTEKGVANGVATLDGGGTVPISQLPAAVLGALSYQGTWNATTNTPTLFSSVGTKGYYYVVSVAGSTDLNGITDWQIGDWAVYNGTAWQKIDNTDAVTSVNGLTGTVVLTTTNVAEGTNLYYTDARARASVSGGTGISYNSTSGVITNSAPDQTVSITGAGTSVVTGTYPNFTVTSNDAFVGTVTSVGATAGTGISVTGSPITTSGTLVITNTAPDQTVAIASGTGISVTGTYPNFTVTNTSPSSGGTVTSVGGTGTVNGLTLTGTVTTSGNLTLGGTLNLSSPPVIGGTTPAAITGTVITANTQFVSENYYAQSILGGNLRTSGGTSLLNWDGGGSGNITVNGGLNANPSNKNISLAPTGTGSVTINPATAGTMNNMVIGGTTPLAITGTTITATKYVGVSGGTF